MARSSFLPLAILLLSLGLLRATVVPDREACANEGAARLVVEGLSQRPDGVYLHTFGQAAQEEELDQTFKVRNTGDAQLEGLRAVGDCGCYGVTLSTTKLAPGESADIHVKFRTMMMSGRLTKRLRLHHAADEDHPLTIRLLVDVVAGVVVEPHRFWFDDALVGHLPNATVVVKWKEGVGRPFEITAVEVPGQDFQVDMTPYADDGWKGTAVKLTFRTPPPLGLLSGMAIIHTTHPEYPRISLALTANVTGKVWVQSRIVQFGWIPKGKGRTALILIKPYDPATVDLGTVGAKSRHGRVEVETRKAPPGPDQGWQLVIRVPADAPSGRLDDVVEVHSKVVGEEVTEIQIRGEVLEDGE